MTCWALPVRLGSPDLPQRLLDRTNRKVKARHPDVTILSALWVVAKMKRC
jgi:hypothetical protein